MDSLIGTGPIRCAVLTEITGPPSSEPLGPAAPGRARQVVACTGSGASGALSILRRSVLPDVITEVPLAGLLCSSTEALSWIAILYVARLFHMTALQSLTKGPRGLSCSGSRRMYAKVKAAKVHPNIVHGLCQTQL